MVWGTIVPVAPRVAGAVTPESPLALVVAAAAAYQVGGIVCHQRADRSFHSGGVQWPVCARCAGLYMSAGLGALVMLVGRRRVGRARTLTSGRAMLLVMGAAAPTAISWAAERSGLAATSNARRAALAVPLGLAVSALVAVAGYAARDARGPEVN
ncbi:MAG TPA: DUF2085 domain-containing protein [Vicinamibacterales bacterium]|nr:DUF2085 domain-containing protein [Vicinamibacterales bacterium]